MTDSSGNEDENSAHFFLLNTAYGLRMDGTFSICIPVIKKKRYAVKPDFSKLFGKCKKFTKTMKIMLKVSFGKYKKLSNASRFVIFMSSKSRFTLILHNLAFHYIIAHGTYNVNGSANPAFESCAKVASIT